MKSSLSKALLETFLTIRDSDFEGVKGVLILKSIKKTPVIGVTICTHGNELCGLAAAEYLIEAHQKGNLNTTVFIVINNLMAVERQINQAFDDSSKNRFVDINMNRLPDNLHEPTYAETYEVRRAVELLPVWKQFKYSLDFHSTTQDCESMLIDINNNFPLHLANGFGIKKLIKNITALQVGKPASAYYGSGGDTVTCAVECGQHYKEETFDFAKNVIEKFLENLKERNDHGTNQRYEEYKISRAIIFPDNSYELVDTFMNFAKISKGTLLAKGNGPNIDCDINGHTLFAGRKKFDTYEEIQEEVIFISEPVKIVSE